MKSSHRALLASAALAFAAAGLPAVALAKQVAYYTVGQGNSSAYLIDWKGTDKARLVSSIGAQPGGVADNGTQKLVTLDAPIFVFYDSVDACNEEIQVRQDTFKVVVRDLPGSVSQIVEIGTLTNIGGCQDHFVTPFGSESDPGTSMTRLAMKSRPAMGDIVEGLEMAGPSEEPPWTPYSLPGAQDVVTFGPAQVIFHATGHSYPASIDADQWLVIVGPDRGYTRLALDAKTGGETWLMADRQAGQPVRVESARFVKPLAGAGFGTVAQASRMWQSGLFINTRRPFFIYLYKNGTGERVQKNLDDGTESHAQISAWEFAGLNLQQHRIFDGGFSIDRTWTPLRNEGKVHWVMEGELIHDNGDSYVNIPPRVNYYLDTGKAVPPAEPRSVLLGRPLRRELRKLEQ